MKALPTCPRLDPRTHLSEVDGSTLPKTFVCDFEPGSQETSLEIALMHAAPLTSLAVLVGYRSSMVCRRCT